MPAHAHALRRGRFSYPGYVYQITTVTRRREQVFADFGLARLTIGELQKSDALGRCQTLARVKTQTQTVLNTLDAAQTRTNVMNRALKKVEALPDGESQALLPGLGEEEADG